MSKTIKTVSIMLSVLMITGVMSVANPVFATEVNENYLMTETLNALESGSVSSNCFDFLGIDDTFDYHKQDVGRAGTIYFNDFNENIFIERDDLGLYTPYMPVQITSLFTNNPYYSANGFGYGWRTNYNQTVEYINENGEEKFIYYDENGKIFHFEKTEKTDGNKQVWKPVESEYLEDYEYRLCSSMTDYGNLAEVSISCNKSIYRYFNSEGALCKISHSLKNSEDTLDSTEYSIFIEYFNTQDMPASLKIISKIIDGVGREYRFSYNKDTATNKFLVASVEVFDSSGSPVLMDSVPYKLTFNYDSITEDGVTYATLKNVAYPDGETVEYNLSKDCQLLKNIDGYAIEINKNSDSTHTITEKVYTSQNDFITGAVLNIAETNQYEKVFTDSNNTTQTKQFDFYGRTIATINSDGTIIPVIYHKDKSTAGKSCDSLYNTDYYTNTYLSENLILNGDFSDNKANWEADDCTVVSEHSNSLKFNTSGTESVWASQVINVTDGVNGDEYAIEFSTKQVNTLDNSNALSLVLIEARNNTSGSESWTTVDSICINQYNPAWQTLGYQFKVKMDHNEIKVSLCYNQIGEVYFDDVKLFKTEKFTNYESITDELLNDLIVDTYKNGSDFTATIDDLSLKLSTFYDEDTWYNQTLTDFNNNASSYLYDSNSSLLTQVTDGNGSVINYSYNSVEQLKNISQVVEGLSNGSAMSTSYTYENDRIKSITHNGFSYNYSYDAWGNVTSVKVGTQNLVSYEYSDKAHMGQVNKITYGNGDYINYTYNANDDITSIKLYSENGTLKSHYEYTYNNKTLTKIADLIHNTETIYNGETVTVKLLNGTGTEDDVIYNTFTVGENDSTLENYGGVCYNTIREDEDSLYTMRTSVTPANSSEAIKEYKFFSEKDSFGRVLNKGVSSFYEYDEEYDFNMDLYFNSEYKYKNISETQTTALVDSFKTEYGICAVFDGELETEVYEEKEYFYDYDNVGNIIRIYTKEYDDNGIVTDEITVHSYSYDKAGQLVRENNSVLEKTYVYVYDVGGNIVSKTEYSFTETQDLSSVTPIDTINYTYDAVWKDKLVNFDGTAINYDEMGNPLNYVKCDITDGSMDVGTLTWNGRQLESVTVNGSVYKYSYDSNGLRTRTDSYSESTGDYTGGTQYLWRDGKLAGYSTITEDGEIDKTIKIIFDDTGDSIGYTYYSQAENVQATFYFEKNLQGDIVTVYDDEGSAMVTYNYDAWGRVSAKTHGTSPSSIMSALVALMFTPITYRGYNYDINTGLYYLQTRYYNPAYGRFLNADTTEILERTKGTILGANIFAYCNNNPVMNVDYAGEYPLNNPDSPTWVAVGYFAVVLTFIYLFVSESDKQRIRDFLDEIF